MAKTVTGQAISRDSRIPCPFRLCWPTVFRVKNFLYRHVLPLVISGGALVYVFGYAIDWQAIPDATERANLPLFIAITILDKIVFFLVWCLVQASMVRRFLAPVPRRQIIAVKGGAELARALNHSVSDAAFFLGIWQLCRAPLQSVVAVTTLPFVAHFFVLLLQGTVALFFVPRDQVQFTWVAGVVVFGWTLVMSFAVARRLGAVDRLYALLHLDWLEGRVNLRDLVPYLWIFAGFAAADVLIQGMATRAFGNPIDWIALISGIPVLYFMMMLPSFGNFGTREIVWASVFHGYGDEASLYAFALWTNLVFLAMHVIIGVAFLNRAMALFADLRRTRAHVESVRAPILRDALDP
ncbi:MAG: hypothetical protein CL933_26295 [Deltaproteobacteria bacterium]|nr:hypothetical protein [Deltaproteobacteria bacterium]